MKPTTLFPDEPINDEDHLIVSTGNVYLFNNLQGELPLEPIGEEQLKQFAQLGYSEADLAGRPDAELINILENRIANPERIKRKL
jgi:hypothetical protein